MKMNIEKPVDNIKNLQDKLERELDIKGRELSDTHNAMTRLSNLREARARDSPYLEREVDQIKSLIAD